MKQLKHSPNALLKAAIAVLAAGLIGLGGGCSSPQAKSNRNEDAGEAFLAPGEVSEVSRLNDEQIATGAGMDSTLRAYHFRRGSLNSLGRQKLDRMIAANDADATDAGGDDGEAMVVYLDASPNAGASDEAAKRLSSAREDAISDYLMSRGLAENMFRIEIGYNPNDTFLATSALGSSAATPEAGAAAPAGAPATGATGPAPGGTTTK